MKSTINKKILFLALALIHTNLLFTVDPSNDLESRAFLLDCAFGRTEEVQGYINAGADLNYIYSESSEPPFLFVGRSYRNETISEDPQYPMNYLLAVTAETLEIAESIEQRTGLGIAVDHNEIGIIKILLKDKGINPNKGEFFPSTPRQFPPSTPGHRTPLGMAIVKRHKKAVEALLDDPYVKRDEVDFSVDGQVKRKQTALGLACMENDLGIVKILLADPKVDPNKGEIYNDGEETSPLSLCCINGYIDIIEILLKAKGIDPNRGELFPSGGGSRSPLAAAVAENNEAAVKALLDDPNVERDEVDFSVNDQVKRKQTALGLACMENDLGIVKILLADPKVDPNKGEIYSDGEETSPLSLCCINGHIDIINILLEAKGIDPNRGELFPSGQRRSPLAAAVIENNEAAVEALLRDSHVNPGIGDVFPGGAKQSPKEIAEEKGYWDISDLFESKK